MDALTHAIEAYISTMAMPETDEMARTATAMIISNLPAVFHNGSDMEARENMLLASSLAGMAFTRAGVGYVHAIAHQLGGLYHIPHGLANAIILPYVLEFSKPACRARLAELAKVAHIGTDSMGNAERADAFIEHIRHLNATTGIPSTVKELRPEDMDIIIERAFAEAHGTYGVPRYMSRSEAKAILQSARS
jgi:alcohol dehydrogenase class IV